MIQSKYRRRGASDEGVIAVIVIGGILLLATCGFGGGCYVHPKWKVWQQGLAGEALLRRAEQEKMILIEQAKAEVESASFRAQAIATVGKAAQEFPEYRKQEFMGAFADALQNRSIQKIIFVPTEANIPIVEAGRTVRD